MGLTSYQGGFKKDCEKGEFGGFGRTSKEIQGKERLRETERVRVDARLR